MDFVADPVCSASEERRGILRLLACTILSVPLFAAGFLAGKQPAQEGSAPIAPARANETSSSRLPTAHRSVSLGAEQSRGLYRGVTAAAWAARYRARTRQLQHARRVLFARPSVAEAINLAAAVYGNGPTLWRKARCESGLNPGARNGSEASGLFQFLPSTWATTPFGSFSIFSPYASALAAGWMHANGRGSEWVCR